MIYKYIRSVKQSNSISPTVFYYGIPVAENIDKPSLFNEYFSVFTTSNFELPANPDQFDPTTRRHLLSIQVFEQEVLDALILLHL